MVGLLAAHGVYAGAMIARTSFVIEGKRYFCLYDDAMITLQYARNLAEGHGLVWNAGGPHVEGFTSPAWTLLLAGVAWVVEDPVRRCLVVQCLGIPIIWLTALGALRLARASRMPDVVGLMAALWVLVYYNLNNLTLLGMETGLAAAVMTFGLAAVMRAITRRTGTVWSTAWIGPMVLVRPEALVFGLFAGAVEVLGVRRRRWQPVLGAALGLLLVAGYVGWRWSYYGALVPNTYVLKLTGWPWWDRLRVALHDLPVTVVSLGPLVLLALAGVRGIRQPRFALLLLLPLLAIAYQIYVGGDHLPRDRFVVPFVPALAVMGAYGLTRLARLVVQAGWLTRRTWPIRVGAAAIVVAFNAVSLPHALLLVPPQSVEQGNSANVAHAIIINRYTDPDTTVAVGFAGTVPYFTGRTCVDLLGKCDPHIAHLPAKLGIRAGHNKYDFAWSLNHYKPDLISAGGPKYYDDPVIRAHYRVRRYPLDGGDVFLLVRDGSRVRGGKTYSWAEIDRRAVYPQGQSW
ncbi:MAG: hypothetical protein H6816_03625 [Phycisphaerales bacterium]|nr:hypothetical protein [Phycisphaerales bacterium]